MNPTAWDRVASPYSVVTPQTRAQRRAQQQSRARAERVQRRSRARIERALSAFSKESK